MTTASYRDRIREAAARSSPLVVALDCPVEISGPAKEAGRLIGAVKGSACAVKINFHILLRAGPSDVSGLCGAAHDAGMAAIADIKINDIGSTNEAASGALWSMGFDAVIANPIMGRDALARLARSAHGSGAGVIALCHMSAPEARAAYGAEVRMRAEARGGGGGAGGRAEPLYRRFLEWSRAAGADGIVVGATVPGVIKECAQAARGLDVYSPGVGAQGGDGRKALAAGASYVIAGRSIIGARCPAKAAAAEAARLTGQWKA